MGARQPEILPQLAKELVQLRVALLIATARPSIEAAKAATTELPIIANDLESDPIASGYVATLARPGSNLTGLFFGFANVVQQMATANARDPAQCDQDCGSMGCDDR